jgi:HK97 family phage prohead protease
MSKPLHLPEGREARVVTTPPSIEYRALEGGGQEPAAFVGQAIVCGVRSSPLGYPGFRFVEIIDARALDTTDMSDVIGVFNHDPNLLLGRTRNNTLTLERTADGGLSYRIPYDPQDPDHQRVMRKIERGDVDGSSFLFRAKKDDWQEEKDAAGGSLYVRTVLEIETLYDVCPVTSPAYPDATAAKRSHEAYQQEHPAPPTGPCMDLLEKELALAAIS